MVTAFTVGISQRCPRATKNLWEYGWDVCTSVYSYTTFPLFYFVIEAERVLAYVQYTVKFHWFGLDRPDEIDLIIWWIELNKIQKKRQNTPLINLAVFARH